MFVAVSTPLVAGLRPRRIVLFDLAVWIGVVFLLAACARIGPTDPLNEARRQFLQVALGADGGAVRDFVCQDAYGPALCTFRVSEGLAQAHECSAWVPFRSNASQTGPGWLAC